MAAAHIQDVALLAEGVGRNTPIYGGERPGKMSPSSRRAWVEIHGGHPPPGRAESPSSRRAWVEIGRHGSGSGYPQSPSSRRAWVEIAKNGQYVFLAAVALLAEGVGRNIELCRKKGVAPVALLAEGVGRNSVAARALARISSSPSSRRAWVEISSPTRATPAASVALLAEGVGRNRSTV